MRLTIATRPRRALLLLALLVFVTMTIGSAFVWTRGTGQLANEAPPIPTTPRSSAESTASGNCETTASNVRTFQVIPGDSKLTYSFDLEAAGLSLPKTVEGSTAGIEGAIHLARDGMALDPENPSRFSVDVRRLKSTSLGVDDSVQGALEADKFPYATFTALNVTGYDPSTHDGQQQAFHFTGRLKLHGVEREVAWKAYSRRACGFLTVLANATISQAEFAIQGTDLARMVSTKDHVKLQVQIVAQATGE